MRYILYIIIVAIDLYAIFLHNPSSRTFEIKAPVMNCFYESSMALEYLNTLRTRAGMPPYTTGAILTKAAQNHSDYLVAHHQNGHFEEPGLSGFTGKIPHERAIAAGYRVAMLTENVSVNALDYKDSVDGLFAAVYHRFGFLDFQSDEIGIGVSQDPDDTDYNAFVYDMGVKALNDACSGPDYDGAERYAYKVCVDPAHKIRESRLLQILNASKVASKPIVIYPYENQTDVPPVFYDETPDPLPGYEVSGFPVTVQFNDYYIKGAAVHAISLFGPDGKELPSKILYAGNDPHHMLKKGYFALLPLHRLAYGTQYKVVLDYSSGGKHTRKVWHFKTRELPEPAITIAGDEKHVTIEPHRTYTLYFKPRNPHDRLTSLHFPADLKVRFLDLNTVQIRLQSDNRAPFTLKSGDRRVDFSVR